MVFRKNDGSLGREDSADDKASSSKKSSLRGATFLVKDLDNAAHSDKRASPLRPKTSLYTGGDASGTGESSSMREKASLHADGEPKSIVDSEKSSSPMEDPPVGWLVIVSGHGKGGALQIGYGANAIGRDRQQRISVDWGDNQISRQDHARIVYDAKKKKFYIQQGSSSNLVYLHDEAVLVPTELHAHDQFQIGETVFAFIPFCGDQFDWAMN